MNSPNSTGAGKSSGSCGCAKAAGARAAVGKKNLAVCVRSARRSEGSLKGMKNAVTVEAGTWFHVAKTMNHVCCRCLSRHRFKFRVRANGNLEMLVE